MTFSIDTAVLAVIVLLGVIACLVLTVHAVVRDGARATAPARLGDYLLAEKIGEGAMGQVYRARHVVSGAWRAVKVLPPGASARDRLRFENEAALGATVRHDNAVAIYERGEAPDGTAYYAMELVEGASLQQLVEREGALAPERAVGITTELCAALAALHGQGLVHRDVKPDNVLVYRAADGSERVKLVDFGLVRRVGGAGAEGSSEVVGTPLYLSPEAIAAPETVNGKSDLYAVGAALYFLLSGAPVFNGRSVVEVCCQQLHAEPARLGQDGKISRELERVVLDCLAKDPAARPGSALELSARLVRCSASQGARVTRLVPRRAAANVGCAAAAA